MGMTSEARSHNERVQGLPGKWVAACVEDTPRMLRTQLAV